MYSNHAATAKKGEPIFHTVNNNGASAIVQGAPLCLDITAIAGGTATDDGTTITAEQAIGTFVAVPSTANRHLFAGIAEEQIGSGRCKRAIHAGPAKARVYNPTAGTLSLPVGTPLVQVPGQSYFQPVVVPRGATPTLTASKRAALAHAVVTQAVSIAATSVHTSLVPVWLFPPTPPRLQSLLYHGPGAQTTSLTIPLLIAPGPGEIVDAGFGLEDCGSAGFVDLDVTVNGTSIWTTKPKIANDGTNGSHTLKTATAALGTGGTHGVVDTTKTSLVPGDKIAAVYTVDTGTAQAGLQIQVDVLWS